MKSAVGVEVPDYVSALSDTFAAVHMSRRSGVVIVRIQDGQALHSGKLFPKNYGTAVCWLLASSDLVSVMGLCCCRALTETWRHPVAVLHRAAAVGAWGWRSAVATFLLRRQ